MKGYPKFRAVIEDQSMIRELEVIKNDGPKALFMVPYTSDKGREGWRTINKFEDLTKVIGPISFVRHGQGLLTLAEILRNGGSVLCNRMVSSDATLANVTVRARVIKADNVSNVYIYTKSEENAKDFESVREAALKHVELNDGVPGSSGTDDADNIDVALFSVAAAGRGESSLTFKIVPEYNLSRTNFEYALYSFEVYDGVNLLDNISFTMNPNVIVNGISQAMNPKLKTSEQIQVKFYDDEVYKLVETLGVTALSGGAKVDTTALLNYDFLYGYNNKGKATISGINYIGEAKDDVDTNPNGWTAKKPTDLTDKAINLSAGFGVKLEGGSYGTMGSAPIDKPDEYKKLLLDVFGKTTGALYDPVIYDGDAYKLDFIVDCNWPDDVKKQVINVVDARGDCDYFADMGTKFNTVDAMLGYFTNIPYSISTSWYHNFFKVYDPYTRREITVTMPYLLATKLCNLYAAGATTTPLAGVSNGMSFPEIIEGTINFVPHTVPGLDQKQMLVDRNINYLNLYDGVPVLDAEFTNNETFSQLSFVNNVVGIHEVIKALRTTCPRTRFTLVSGGDLQIYLDACQNVIEKYKNKYELLEIKYMADEKYEVNKVFYATLVVKCKEFFQEEYFKVIAIN